MKLITTISWTAERSGSSVPALGCPGSATGGTGMTSSTGTTGAVRLQLVRDRGFDAAAGANPVVAPTTSLGLTSSTPPIT